MLERINKRDALLLLFILALTVVSYLPGMNGGFYFDDKPNIVDATVIHWDSITFANMERLVKYATNSNRIVSNTSFALNYLAGELNPAGYHWTNLIIHLLTGLMLIWTSFLLINPVWVEANQPKSIVAPILATGIFLLHPLNIQAVTYIVQRMASLTAFFILLSLALYITARKKKGGNSRYFLSAAAVFAWLMALASKENALALPLVICAYEYCFYRQWWGERIIRMDKTFRLFLISASFLIFIFITWFLVKSIESGVAISWFETFPGRDFSGYQRLLTQTRAHFFYLSLLFWPAPSRLNLEHEFALSYSLFNPLTTLAALIGILLFLWIAYKISKKYPYFGFPLLAYVIFHLIESGPVNLELIFEHRMYLPIAALSWLAANLFVLIIYKSKSSVIPVLSCLLVLLILAGATYKRNSVWGNPVDFLTDCATKSPNKFRPHYNLGTELGMSGRYREGEDTLKHALTLKPSDSKAHNQLANIYMLTGRIDKALQHYKEAVQNDPNNYEALHNLARLLDNGGKFNEALPYYLQFLQNAPPTYSQPKNWVRERIRAR